VDRHLGRIPLGRKAPEEPWGAFRIGRQEFVTVIPGDTVEEFGTIPHEGAAGSLDSPPTPKGITRGLGAFIQLPGAVPSDVVDPGTPLNLPLFFFEKENVLPVTGEDWPSLYLESRQGHLPPRASVQRREHIDGPTVQLGSKEDLLSIGTPAQGQVVAPHLVQSLNRPSGHGKHPEWIRNVHPDGEKPTRAVPEAHQVEGLWEVEPGQALTLHGGHFVALPLLPFRGEATEEESGMGAEADRVAPG
jgi:hypothetical protein